MSVTVSQDLTIAAAGEYLFVTNAATGSPSTSGAPGAAPGISPTNPVEKDTTSSEIANWGEDNQFPTQVREDMEQSEILNENLNWKADAWYGDGLIYGLVTLDEKGN